MVRCPMKAINKILLNVHPDFTDVAAINYIAAIASKTQPEIEVLHVIEDYPEDLREWWNVCHPIRLYEAIVTKRQECMDGVVDRIKAAGVEHVETKLRWGSALQEVTREVAENNYELVMTTARPRRWAFKGARDCLCTGLCRQCPSLVWVTKNHSRLPAQRILVALEVENGTVRSDSLNTKILRTAGWVAAAYGSEVHVVHTLSPSELKGAEVRRASVDWGGYVQELRNQIQQTCNSVLNESGQSLAAEHIHLMRGSPRAIIPQLVQQQSMSLILMGTRARKGLVGLLEGKTAEKIMDKMYCDVLIVKPDGFISPLLLNERV